jgi:hypothetical protein
LTTHSSGKRLTTRLRLATTRVSERGEDVIVNLQPVEWCRLMEPVKRDDHVTLSTKLDGLASMTVPLLVEPYD